MTRYIDAVKWKWRALKFAVKLRGKRDNDLWRVKRPLGYVKEAERICKFRVNLLEQEELSLVHESGCSMQYIAMLAYILGDEPAFSNMLNPHDEYVPPKPKTRFKLTRLYVRNQS